MTKEYTGPEFRLEFKRADYEWEKGGRVGPDPRTQWEHKSGGVPRWSDHPIAQHPGFAEGVLYRWKLAPKRMVTISYKTDKMALPVARTVVAPEVEALLPDTVFYRFKDPHHVQRWCGGKQDRLDLTAGEVFLAREDAQDMSDWLAVCRKGGQS